MTNTVSKSQLVSKKRDIYIYILNAAQLYYIDLHNFRIIRNRKWPYEPFNISLRLTACQITKRDLATCRRWVVSCLLNLAYTLLETKDELNTVSRCPHGPTRREMAPFIALAYWILRVINFAISSASTQ